MVKFSTDSELIVSFDRRVSQIIEKKKELKDLKDEMVNNFNRNKDFFNEAKEIQMKRKLVEWSCGEDEPQDRLDKKCLKFRIALITGEKTAGPYF